MPAWSFQTVPEELLAAATLLAEWYKGRGFSVATEKAELSFPYTPTLVCSQGHTRCVVDLIGHVVMDRVEEWVAYGRSCGEDFRFLVALVAVELVSAQQERRLHDLGVGLLIVDERGVVERLAATDLALNVGLPDRRRLKAKARNLLGAAYDFFRRGQWREGFEDACRALEEESRRYLKRHSRRGRIKLVKGGKAVELTAREIDRLTLGQMIRVFEQIVTQNKSDRILRAALMEINKDRIGVVHHKSRKRVEESLRRNVGKHMWTIVKALDEAVD